MQLCEFIAEIVFMKFPVRKFKNQFYVYTLRV